MATGVKFLREPFVVKKNTKVWFDIFELKFYRGAPNRDVVFRSNWIPATK